MDCFYKILLTLWLVSVAGLALSVSLEEDKIEISPRVEDLLRKEKESDDVPPKIMSKTLTFLHNYNDTQLNEEVQTATSKFRLDGSLENRIQNIGGIQKTILNNKVQYNFYFWLLPKNFNRTAWEKH